MLIKALIERRAQEATDLGPVFHVKASTHPPSLPAPSPLITLSTSVMKVSFTLGWGLIASTTASSLSDAFIGTSDKPRRLSDKPAVISPETSRLALAQRLGLSQYHTLGNVDDEALELLDQLPGIRPQLFSDKEFQPFPRVLTIVESVDDPQGDFLSGMLILMFRC